MLWPVKTEWEKAGFTSQLEWAASSSDISNFERNERCAPAYNGKVHALCIAIVLRKQGYKKGDVVLVMPETLSSDVIIALVKFGFNVAFAHLSCVGCPSCEDRPKTKDFQATIVRDAKKSCARDISYHTEFLEPYFAELRRRAVRDRELIASGARDANAEIVAEPVIGVFDPSDLSKFTMADVLALGHSSFIVEATVVGGRPTGFEVRTWHGDFVAPLTQVRFRAKRWIDRFDVTRSEFFDIRSEVPVDPLNLTDRKSVV